MISMKYVFNVNKDFISFYSDSINYNEFKSKYDILLKESMSLGEVFTFEFEGFIGDDRVTSFEYDFERNIIKFKI